MTSSYLWDGDSLRDLPDVDSSLFMEVLFYLLLSKIPPDDAYSLHPHKYEVLSLDLESFEDCPIIEIVLSKETTGVV